MAGSGALPVRRCWPHCGDGQPNNGLERTAAVKPRANPAFCAKLTKCYNNTQTRMPRQPQGAGIPARAEPFHM